MNALGSGEGDAEMKIPAQAFAQLYPKDLAPGRLFKFRDSWALRVSHGAEVQGFLILEGERAGWVYPISPGMSQVVAIIEPFRWFPMVSVDAKPTMDADRTVTLTLTGNGPVIVGADSRDDWGSTYIAFGPDGQSIEEQDHYHEVRFEQWSVELCHRDRPYSSLGALLVIDRRKLA